MREEIFQANLRPAKLLGKTQALIVWEALPLYCTVQPPASALDLQGQTCPDHRGSQGLAGNTEKKYVRNQCLEGLAHFSDGARFEE